MSISDRLDDIEAVAVYLDDADMEAEVLAATAALRAVLDLHQTKRNGYCDHCTAIAEAGCGIEAPCPTVCTIATALGEDTP